MWLKVVDGNAKQDIKDYSNLGRLSNQMLDSAKNYCSQELYKTFETVKASGSDTFETVNKLYRKFPNKYNELGDTVKQMVKANFTVKCYNYS